MPFLPSSRWGRKRGGQAIVPVSSGEVLTVTVGSGGTIAIGSSPEGTSSLAVDGTTVVSATSGSGAVLSTTP